MNLSLLFEPFSIGSEKFVLFLDWGMKRLKCSEFDPINVFKKDKM